jgi:CheY-like chemotaxis protein
MENVGRALRRIMVIEDNTFLALALEETLAHLGHQVTASAQRLDQALQLLEQADFDCAIVDVDLHGLDAFPLLDRLRQRAIRYVLATGLPLSEIPEHYRRDVLVTKPYDVNELERAIAKACAA